MKKFFKSWIIKERNKNKYHLFLEPTSRDPMVESNSSSGSDTNEPACTQLLTQLNEAYTHLAPDAQALVRFFNNQLLNQNNLF